MSSDETHCREGIVTVRDGLKMHFSAYPGSAAAPPLLCLHGLTRNSKDFAAFARRHSPRFRVIAPDFRGRGRSEQDPLPKRYNALTYASDVVELLDQLGIGGAIFVGTSLGGLVTMTMTAVAPDRIAGAILNDIGPDLSRAGLDRIMTYVGQDIRFKSWDQAAQALADNHQQLPAWFTHRDWLAMAHRLCRLRDGEIVFDYDLAIAVPLVAGGAAPRVDLWPLFNALARKPLLVIRGEHSDLLSAEAMEKMRLAAPSAEFAVVDGVGHPPTLDEPAAVAAIDKFLDTIEN